MKAPYIDSSGPTDTVGTISSSTTAGNTIFAFSGYKVTLGYYYGYLQGEISYAGLFIKNQEIEDTSSSSTVAATGDSGFLDLKLGMRFSNPGDATYNFIYLGGRRMAFETDFNNTSAVCYGYFAGYHGFFSFYLDSDFEFVLSGEFYIGVYKMSDFSSDVNIGQDVNDSLILGGSIGVGVLYEPFNIAALIKAAPEFDNIGYERAYGGTEVNISAYTGGVYLGFELVYTLPSYKYNREE
ncbi:MAG: hypothetical protein GY754_17940 [bacterium]|nr:hypothetical protein [bacterium]